MSLRRAYAPTPRPWSLEGLMAVHILNATGATLHAIAEAVGRPRGEVDLALWALLGRTPEDALSHLNDPPAASVFHLPGVS